MAQFTCLYPYFGSYQGSVIYYKSTFSTSFQYLIVVNDEKACKRTGIRVATFSYDKKDDRYEKPVVRYGNTSTKTRLPNRRFEEAIKQAIQHHEGVFQPVADNKYWLHILYSRFDKITKRIFDEPGKRFHKQ